jgi:hypothetical protein
MGCRANGDDRRPQMSELAFCPQAKGKEGLFAHTPVYARFLTTSYKGQLLAITFTTNLNTNAELKQEIDLIMDSVASRRMKQQTFPYSR